MWDIEIYGIGVLRDNFYRCLGMVVYRLVFSSLCIFEFFSKFSQFFGLLSYDLVFLFNHIKQIRWGGYRLHFGVVRVWK